MDMYLAPASSGIPFWQRCWRPSTLQTVSIIFLEEEKGTSTTRLYWAKEVSSNPALREATTIGASDELPRGSYFRAPVSSSLTCSRTVLQQRRPLRRQLLTPMSWPASRLVPDRMILPTVGSKPFPSTSYFWPAAYIFTSVILPSVSVPVLSLQITEAEPRVSTAANLRTKTCFVTISLQPMESEMVTHRGMPSGMAATARVTEMRTM
mmetsp:Transcript_38705/g.82189  ORF Transcript_38705/g.82189 Transcript_38705/m.82189 type:complete len:208 (-) Transcript_38705:1047-1670(-)